MPYENLDKLDAKAKKTVQPPKETLAPSVMHEHGMTMEEEEEVPQPPAWEPYQEAGVLTPLERKRMDELSHFLDISAIARVVTEVCQLSSLSSSLCDEITRQDLNWLIHTCFSVVIFFVFLSDV